MAAPVVDHKWVVEWTINMVSAYALDPDELWDLARKWGGKTHPAIVLDEMSEVEIHYVTGWKTLFTEEEQIAVERYIGQIKALPVIEDTIWDDPSLANMEWQTLRSEARRLINALGGLPDDLPGKWAKK